MTESYVVAGRAPWSRETFDDAIATLPGEWTFVATTADLEAAVASGSPRYLFFLHWSDIVAASITESVECVCFHMADLPIGRGGSPLQHQVAAGATATVLTAFRMTDELDAGPVYGKRPLSLLGSAEEIYLRAGTVAAELVAWISAEHPEPVDQTGEATMLRRRTPSMSELSTDLPALDAVHDVIRMLDADGYPHAYLDHGRFRYTFRRATRRTGSVEADVTITLIPEETT